VIDKMNPKAGNWIPKAIIALWVAVVIFGFGYEGWKELWLSLDGKEISATLIVQGHGMKPGVFVYEYTINGVQYNGDCRPGGTARLGDQILVFVSASHPSFSSFKVPNFPPWTALMPIVLLLSLEVYLLKTLIRRSENSSNVRA
jgi:hypothetical protein